MLRFSLLLLYILALSLPLGLGPWSGRALLLWSDSLAVASQLRDQKEGRENGAWNKRNKNGPHSTEIISAVLFAHCFGIYAFSRWLEKRLFGTLLGTGVEWGSLEKE